jgi:hypothetical protein
MMSYKNESNMLIPKMSALVVAMLFGGSIPAFADEQSEQLMKQRIEQLESQVTKLQAMVEQVVDSKKGPAIDGNEDEQKEIGRIRLKVEALEESREKSGFKDLKISGMIDPVYMYNRARNSAGFNFLGNFNNTSGAGTDIYAYDNSYFGQARLQLDKELEGGTKFKLVIVPHKSVNSTSIIHEASMSVPLTDTNTRLLAGQIPDWSGYEYYFADQQKLITHNLLFDFTLPSFYTGAGLELDRGNWIMKGLVANMNKVSHDDGEKNPVIAYRADYTINEYSGFGFAGVEGKIKNSTSTDKKRLDTFEVDGFYTRGQITWNGQVGIGRTKNGAFNGGDAEWQGISNLLAYKITPVLEASARLDYLHNSKNGGGGFAIGGFGEPGVTDFRNGFGPTADDAATFAADPTFDIKGANRSALSLGLDYALNTNVMLKAEFRFDHANIPVFQYVRSGSFKDNNEVFGVSTILSY